MTHQPKLEDWRVTAERVYQERQQQQATVTEAVPPTSTPGPQPPRDDESPILKWWHGMTSRGRGLTIGAAIGLALIGLAQFGEPVEPTKTAVPEPAPVQNEAPKAAPQVVPEAAPAPAPPAQAVKPEPPKPTTAKGELEQTLGRSSRLAGPRLTSFDDEGDTVAIVFAIDENLTTNLTNRAWRRDVVEILEIVRRYYPGKHVTIGGTFSMRDAYGNVGEKNVVLLNYSPSTIQRINWSEDGQLLLPETIVEIADPSPKMVHPEFAAVKK